MNKANILALADFIEKAEYEFDMSEGWANLACGSAGCIGGHAAVLWEDIRSPLYDKTALKGLLSWDTAKLANKLDISLDDEKELCFVQIDADGDYIAFSEITREMAVEALRHLAETGEVKFRR